jgi:hypothetical protein
MQQRAAAGDAQPACSPTGLPNTSTDEARRSLNVAVALNFDKTALGCDNFDTTVESLASSLHLPCPSATVTQVQTDSRDDAVCVALR